jgi:hypothetical protein
VVTVDDDRTAALVIRVWLEGPTDQFRGRLTVAHADPGAETGGVITVAVASSPRELTDALSQWLDDFVRDAANQIDTE